MLRRKSAGCRDLAEGKAASVVQLQCQYVVISDFILAAAAFRTWEEITLLQVSPTSLQRSSTWHSITLWVS